jgi:hypothetical protein
LTQSLTLPEPFRSIWPRSRVAGLLLAIALLAGSLLRLQGVGEALLFGDELHSLRIVAGGYETVLTTFGDKGSGLALPLLQRLLFDLIGTGHWSIRAPAWVPSLLLLFAVWPLGRRIVGEPAAVVATALVAVNPILIFYARFGRIYSLVALLSLVLLYLLERTLTADSPSRGRSASLVCVTALLPWAHPTALGFVLPVYAAAVLAATIDPRREAGLRRRRALELLALLAAGGLLCLLAYWPSGSSLSAFVESRTSGLEYYGEFGPAHVAGLIFGGRWPALGVSGLALAAAVPWLRRRGVLGLPLLAACIGPAFAIALVRPYGDAYAFARYVLPCVAPLALLVGAGLADAVRALRRDPADAAATVLLGAGLALWLAIAGTLGSAGGAAAQHANTYLGLLPLPAFDARWPDAPSFYRELGERSEDQHGRVRILEVPALTTRTRHLYRQYQLQHGAETWLAPLPGEFPIIPDGPYVSLDRRDWLAHASPDFVVVHLDVADETARYWRWIYEEAKPESERGDLAAYMQRHQRYGGLMPPAPRGLAQRLSALFGEPVFEDGTIAVWAVTETPERD